MEQKNMYIGDLAKELAEIDKIVMEEERVESKATSTASCGAWLTLVCC